MEKEKAELLKTLTGYTARRPLTRAKAPCHFHWYQRHERRATALAQKERTVPILSLDTICNSATYFVGQWSPDLKLNQSRDLLRLVLSKMYFPSQGNLFHARIRASHAALADSLDLSREWTCKLVGRLRAERWLETSAPRLPDGKQEITIFRPGRRLKKLLVMLLRSKQRTQKNRVNTSSQVLPTKEQIEKNKAFLAGLISEMEKKMEERQGKKGRQ